MLIIITENLEKFATQTKPENKLIFWSTVGAIYLDHFGTERNWFQELLDTNKRMNLTVVML